MTIAQRRSTLDEALHEPTSKYTEKTRLTADK